MKRELPLGVRKIGCRRNDHLARNGHEGAFERHQPSDQPVTALAQDRKVPIRKLVQQLGQLVDGLRIQDYLGICARAGGVALRFDRGDLRGELLPQIRILAASDRRDLRAPRSRRCTAAVAVGQARRRYKSAYRRQAWARRRPHCESPPARPDRPARRTSAARTAAPRLLATASQDSPPVSRLTASAAAAAASSAPRCFFQAAMTSVAHRFERLLLRQLVIGGAQHHAAAFLDLDDRAQAPVEHVLAEGRVDDRRDLPSAPPPSIRLKSGISSTVSPALRATTSMSVVFCSAASASWSCALLNKLLCFVAPVLGFEFGLAPARRSSRWPAGCRRA